MMRLEDFLTAKPIQEIASNPATWDKADKLVGGLTLGIPISEAYSNAKNFFTDPVGEMKTRAEIWDSMTPEEKLQYRINQVMGATFGGPQAKGWTTAKGKFSSLIDKKPRFEIDDSKSKIILDELNNLYYGKKYLTTLEKVLQHKQLYERYPELKNIPIRLEMDKSGIKAGVKDNTFILNKKELSIYAPTNYKKKEIQSTLLHEIQHVIQEKEGFAKGVNMDSAPYWAMQYGKQLRKEARMLFDKTQDLSFEDRKKSVDFRRAWELIQRADKVEERAINYNEFDLYRRQAGEGESRAVQRRMNYTPEQRQSIDPMAEEQQALGIRLEDWLVRDESSQKNAIMSEMKKPFVEKFKSSKEFINNKIIQGGINPDLLDNIRGNMFTNKTTKLGTINDIIISDKLKNEFKDILDTPVVMISGKKSEAMLKQLGLTNEVRAFYKGNTNPKTGEALNTGIIYITEEIPQSPQEFTNTILEEILHAKRAYLGRSFENKLPYTKRVHEQTAKKGASHFGKTHTPEELKEIWKRTHQK